MFSRVLVANRGLVQANCIRAVKELGATAIAVYEAEDRTSAGVRNADEAYEVKSGSELRPYFDIDRMVELAEKAGVDAVHPGYGFLAQNTEFLQKLKERGITPIAPLMADDLADKPHLKKVAMKIGLPILPGSETHKEFSQLEQAAEELGYPLVMKAARGYGGKGIRIVHKAEELKPAWEQIQEQCQKFAIDTGEVYVEKYFPEARHIEFPVLRDKDGKCVVLPEQDCSVQRKFQKMLVETPSASINDQTRGKLQAIVATLVAQLNIVGFASVEFLYHDGLAYFLEVNGYLQPSHTASGMLTGIDLLQEQIRLVAGDPLNLEQSDVKGSGHVIGAYVMAEDPYRNFTPSPGKIERFYLPFGEGVSLQTNVVAGDVINTFYDSNIAKVMVKEATRKRALRKMEIVLDEVFADGVKNNIPLLRAILASDAFRKNSMTVSALSAPEARSELLEGLKSPELDEIAALLGAVALHYDSNVEQILAGAQQEESVWSAASRWFNRKKMEY